MRKKTIIEKPHRLPAEMYVGKKEISFTHCIKQSMKLFVSDKIFIEFEQHLIEALQKHNCYSHVYLFMPDHLHLIVGGNEKSSSIKKCVDLFKQKTGYWLSKNLPNYKWQKDYYDHVIRNDEDLFNQIRYILNNPVKEKLVEHWEEYPFKGSTICELDEWEW